MKKKSIDPTDDAELVLLGGKIHSHLMKGGRGRVAKYGFGMGDGRIKLADIKYCHVGLFEPEDVWKPVVITNMVMELGDASKEGTLRFLDYLFNNSPYSSCFITKDVSNIYEDGYHIRTTEPANLVAAANIASRIPWEWTRVRDSFFLLVDAGVPPRMSLFLAHKYNVYDDGAMMRRGSTGHTCIEAGQMGVSNVLNFMRAEITGDGKCDTQSYLKAMSYRDIDNMWGRYDQGTSPIDVVAQPRKRIGDNQDPFKVLKKVEAPTKQEDNSLYGKVMSGLTASGFKMEDIV